MEKYRVYAGIDLDAVRYNMESMHNNINKDTKIVAVVKADGYGHGALKIAEAIEDLPYLWGYAVATAEEAEELREHGCQKPMLILGISFPHQYPKIIEEEIRAAVCEYDMAKAFRKSAKAYRISNFRCISSFIMGQKKRTFLAY